MFNEFNWGGYILYRQWPKQKVFIDSQTDFYGEALTREYEQVITASDRWEYILSKYHIEWLIISPNSALAKTVTNTDQWEILYTDETAIILKNSAP